MSALFIKICGMTTPAAVNTALACEVDAIGFALCIRHRSLLIAFRDVRVPGQIGEPDALTGFVRDRFPLPG